MSRIIRIIKPYLLLIFVLILMVGVTINYTVKGREASYKLKIDDKNITYKLESETKPMDTTLLLLILSTIGILAGIWSNPKLRKLEDSQQEIFEKIIEYQEENKKQHTELQGAIKKIMVKADLETSLREIVESVLETTSGDLSQFIAYEGRLFIEFAKDVANGQFTAMALPAVKIKIDQMKDESSERASWLGDRFKVVHDMSQKENVDALILGVTETFSDEMFNSKHKRFKMICEQVLHVHLTDSVKNYLYIRTH